MSSNNVSKKKGEILEDGLLKIQQLEFMFSDLMTRIEKKSETRLDG